MMRDQNNSWVRLVREFRKIGLCHRFVMGIGLSRFLLGVKRRRGNLRDFVGSHSLPDNSLLLVTPKSPLTI